MAKGVIIHIKANAKQFQSSMRMAERKLMKFSNSMSKLGRSMSMSVTAPLALLGTQAVRTFTSFESEMAKVKAVSGATNEEFKDLSENAQELGRNTKFAASEMAQLQLNLSKLGFSSDEILQSTEAITNLSWATGEDLAESARVAAGTLRGFGLDASEMGRVTDVMALSFSSSALDLQKFSDSMNKVAPIAKAMGVSIEESTAMLGTLMDANIEASTAGTMLRQMMLKATKEGFDFNEALMDIKGSTDQAATALKYFDVRSVATSIVLANNSEKVKELTGNLNDSEGAAKSMANIMKDTLGNALTELKSAVEGLSIEFGKTLKPIVQNMAENIKSLVRWFTGLSDETKKIIVQVSLFAAALPPVMLAVAALVKGLIALKAVVLALHAPIAGTIAGIAALGTLALYVYDNWQAFKDLFMNLWIGLGGFLDNIIADMIESVSDFLKLFGVDWLDGIGEGIRANIQPLKTATAEFTTFGETLGKVKDKIFSLFSGFSQTKTALKSVGDEVENVTGQLKEMQSVAAASVSGGDFSENMQMRGETKGAILPPLIADDFGEQVAIMVNGLRSLQTEAQYLATSMMSLDEMFASTFNQMTSSLIKGANSFKQYGTNILNSIKGIISGFIAEGTAAMIMGALKDWATKVPFGYLLAPAAAAVAGGLASTAFNSLIPAFADGGIVSAPTLGMIGEYSGARTNPEVIAPLNKLKNLMGDSTQRIIVQGEIKGSDIWLSQKRYNTQQNRFQ